MARLTDREWHDKERAKAKAEGIDLPELDDAEITMMRGLFEAFCGPEED